MRAANGKQARRGAMAPLFVCLIMLLLVMAAFAVDVGYMVVTQNELQNAADAAALAGASQLETPYVPQQPYQDQAASTSSSNARSEAQKFSLLNQAGGVYIQLASSDIVVGTQASSGGSVTPWVSGGAFPNAVQVTVRRDSTLNGSLSLFLGSLVGSQTWSGTATATATFASNPYTVTGFNPAASGGQNPKILPIAVSATTWSTFLKTGVSPDGNTYDDYTVVMPTSSKQAPSNVTAGADNIPELSGVYPDNTTPGNFGLLDIGPPDNSTPAFESWIVNGPTASDMAYFGSNGLQATTASPASLKGGPGWKSVLQSYFQGIIGQPRILPLYSSYSGQGSDTYYSIVGFAGVTVTSASGRGSNEMITFQPMVVVDPTATTTTTSSSGSSSSSSSYVYKTMPLQLTR